MQPLYQTTRGRFINDKVIFPIIKEIETKIQHDPYLVGTEYSGKSFKGIRHIEITKNWRLLFCICIVNRKYNKIAFDVAKRRGDSLYHACKFCSDACIRLPDITIMFLKIIDHNEQNKIFGGT
jgi:hypothetical protein